LKTGDNHSETSKQKESRWQKRLKAMKERLPGRKIFTVFAVKGKKKKKKKKKGEGKKDKSGEDSSCLGRLVSRRRFEGKRSPRTCGGIFLNRKVFDAKNSQKGLRKKDKGRGLA